MTTSADADRTTSAREDIEAGRTALGIELGSTRIKAVLTGSDSRPLAVGGHGWENQYVDRMWTYSLESVWEGVQQCYAALAADVEERYGVQLTTVGGLGVSAMMHGYLALDVAGELLVPFRTWRNTHTGPAVERLSAEFGVNIPHRWSVAHVFQAVLDGEEHVGRLASLTTLAGYVHERLSGRQVLGVGDASGMFPIDVATGGYDAGLLAQFDRLVAGAGSQLSLAALLPQVLSAGADAGELTADGAQLLDPSGRLQAGAPMCPPEGDAGTGMVATNSVAPRTGNVSAGTSIFAMVVLEQPLRAPHRELDLVTTPAGAPVAMVHCNNGASELDAWVGVFCEFAEAAGTPVDRSHAFGTLFRAALEGEPDAGGLVAFNYLSGEPITELEEGRPLVLRSPGSTFSLANFMRAQLFGSLATLRVGMDVLTDVEQVRLDRMFAHGGLFTTKGVAQRFLAAAIDTPVVVGDIAAEGGAWGIAVLAAFRARRADGQGLDDFLDTEVFAGAALDVVEPDPADVSGFAAYAERFVAALPVQRTAVEHT